MRILFTGASSFTGFAFVKFLAAAGHEVVCPLRGAVEGYGGVRAQRVQQLLPTARFEPQAGFGSERFLGLLQQSGPFDLLCHHGAEVTNYKSPAFDALAALENNTRNLGAVLAAFGQIGGKTIILTGTMFEPDEGQGTEPLRAFSPYGLSKGLTWQVFRYYCEKAGLVLGKFVIPNPFGPWEEERFTSYLMKTWKSGKTAMVKTPDYIRDNIHVGLLAASYAQFAQNMTRATTRISPSGYAESNGAFAARIGREVKSRTGWACDLQLVPQEDFSEPFARTNLEPAAAMMPDWNEGAAWDAFVEYYR